jgi:hypothetical protein
MTLHLNEIDSAKLEQLQGKVINDVAGSLGLLMAYIGDKLDLYSALLEVSPASSRELADNTGMDERYLREWLSANAAAGYVNYDSASGKFSLSPEQAVIFAAEGNAFLCEARMAENGWFKDHAERETLVRFLYVIEHNAALV